MPIRRAYVLEMFGFNSSTYGHELVRPDEDIDKRMLEIFLRSGDIIYVKISEIVFIPGTDSLQILDLIEQRFVLRYEVPGIM